MNTQFEEMNSINREHRLSALKRLYQENPGLTDTFPVTDEVNNHVHTTYSFSPYSPTLAAFLARRAGLQAVGCIDHDSVSGTEEMLDAAGIIGMGATIGCELRLNFTGTPLESKRINNPDSKGIAYIVMHGVPRRSVTRIKEYLAPINCARNQRNRRQLERLNGIIAAAGIPRLDYEKDVLPLSMAHDGGSVTERHLLYALCGSLVEVYGKGAGLLEFLSTSLSVEVRAGLREQLLDPENPYYLYDLLGLLKSTFIEQIFIQPDDEECPNVRDAVKFFTGRDAIPAYAYLGDVGASPTGDKKPQKFEDDYLEELFSVIKDIGFPALTYMPPRNTRGQLKRIQSLCARHGILQISGVDINSPRQSFNCPEIREPEFRHLIKSTWALIAHEQLVQQDPSLGLFSTSNPKKKKSLDERVALYAEIGEKYPRGGATGELLI